MTINLRLLLIMSLVISTISSQGIAQGSDPLNGRAAQQNFEGASWRADWLTSFREGRVQIERDPARVRTGETSIRLHLEPGDCDFNIGRGWNDCTAGNERVGISPNGHVSGQAFYGLSLMLDENLSELAPRLNSNSDINLFQWYQHDSGACFNIQYNTTLKTMNIDVRCPNGVYDHGAARQNRVDLVGPAFGIWHEFIVHAEWTSASTGFFRVLHNGKLVMNYNGPTLARRGQNQVTEAAFIYRYGARDTASTIWLDDVVRARSINDLEVRYQFDRTALGFQ